MKFTLATILAVATSATAQNALQVSPLSAQVLTESQTARIDFTIVDLRDGQNGASTACSTAWNVGEDSATSWYPCENGLFTFNFPNGIAEIGDFVLQARHAGFTGSAALNSHAGTAIWRCEAPGQTAGTDEECNLTEGSRVYLQAAPRV
ncbi:hypothetical protein BDW59DRAFT_165857 [Aspergillus cavernicola]|uniref:AA1-like domain-containing protein n=1 Tax=Aspergillus cavernicola TaxID=176166 RepID=A0ABR4HQF1_9EURO